MKYKLLISIFCVLNITFSLNGQQIYFNKLIRTGIAEQPKSIIEDDSCYYSIGHQIDSNTSNQKLYFYKLDKHGNLLKYSSWGYPYKTYGASEMIQTTDNNLALCGVIVDTATVDGVSVWYGFLTKLTKSGDTIWQVDYYDSISSYSGSLLGFRAISESYDKGFIISGWIRGNVQNENRHILIKTDSMGIIQWQKVYGHTGYEILPWSITITTDSGFFVTGRYWNGQNYDGWLYKTDNYGDKEWEKFLGGQYDDWIESATNTFDGKIVCLLTDTYTDQPYDLSRIVIAKMNLTGGGLIWQKPFYLNRYVQGSKIIELYDKSIVCSGKSYITDTINLVYGFSGFILKLDESGSKLWQREFQYMSIYQGMNEFTPTDLIATQDSGFLICSDLYQNIPYTIPQSSWFVKLDSLGCDTPGCQYIGIPEHIRQPNLVLIYPNPVQDETTVMLNNLTHQTNLHWELYNAAGILVAGEETVAETGRFTLNLTVQPQGNYVLRVINDKGDVWSGKVVKR